MTKFTVLVGAAALFSAMTLCGQSQSDQMRNLQHNIDELTVARDQAVEQAQNNEQSAMREDGLAQSGPAWAGAVHRLAAVGFRAAAQKQHDQARQYVLQIRDLQRQLDDLRSHPQAGGLDGAGPPQRPSPAAGAAPNQYAITPNTADFLNMLEDPTTIEKAIESYFNRNGIKAFSLSGNGGQAHCVQIGFRTHEGQPGVMYRITALPEGSNDLGRWRLLLVTLDTGLKVRRTDSVYTSLNEANKTAHCSWLINDDGELLCRAWPIIPSPQYPVPIDQVLSLVRFMNGDWERTYPPVSAALR